MSMCDPAYILFRYSLILSCVLLCAALISLLAAKESGSIYLSHFSRDLLQAPAGILFVSVLGSVCIEDAAV